MFKSITFGVLFGAVFFTACKIGKSRVLWTGCSEQSAFEKHVRNMNSGGVVVMEVNYFSNYSSPFRLNYKYNIGEENFIKHTIVTSMHDDTYFVPRGGKYMMSYDKKKPDKYGGRRQYIALHKPVYDSTQVFNKTIAEVKNVYFIERRKIFYYGGLQLIFSYKIGDKEYVSHNGINLCEKFPDVKNPEEELSFEGKKFVVEYDVDNPYIARILLDEEVK